MSRLRLVVVLSAVGVAWGATGGVGGVVADPSGSVIVGARVGVRTAQGTWLAETRTGPGGEYEIANLPEGTHVLVVESANFRTLEAQLHVIPAARVELSVRLSISPSPGAVTVTANVGAAEEVAELPQAVRVEGRQELLHRMLPTIGNALAGDPAVLVQQTTTAQVSPLLRGLTGYQTLLLIDGIRFNTSIFRSGPNQYLALVDATQAAAMETLLGPSSVQYGSDSLGGTINVRTSSPHYSTGAAPHWHGEVGLGGSTADLMRGGDFVLGAGGRNMAFSVGAYTRGIGDLRGGRGLDSRNVFVRYMGMDPDAVERLIGSRMPKTGFRQDGFEGKFAWRPAEGHSLTVQHMFSEQVGVEAYRDMMGGAGRVQSAFSPQRLQFGAVRYERNGLRLFDSISARFSVNSQTDGTTRQGLSESDSITRDYSRVSVNGLGVQAVMHAGPRTVIVAGSDFYRERILSTRFVITPATQARVQDRALYPNGSIYTTGGLFGSATTEVLGGRLRLSGGLRMTLAGFETRAAQNYSLTGKQLGVSDSEQWFRYPSFNFSATYRIGTAWSVFGLVGRGIRAPNTTDLSSIGLTTQGFDVTSEAAAAAGALVGTNFSESAVSSGKRFQPLGAEKLTSYEAGVRYTGRKVSVRLQAYDFELHDPLLGRTLVFPAGQAPATVAGYNVTPIAQTSAQAAAGVVTVATQFSPRAMRSMANFGAMRYMGTEMRVRVQTSWRTSFESAYSFQAGRELEPNLPPRRLPPQAWSSRLRYQAGRGFWIQVSGDFSGSQYRMNQADLEDDRMGAARRRSDITTFFRGGIAAPYIDAGPDGKTGSSDDRFTPTGETLAQIRDRVLPVGQTINGVLVAGDSTRVPLFLGTSSFWVFGLSGGMPLAERVTLGFGLYNLTDRNYRLHGSGTDGSGFNATLSLRIRF